jgi:hypothetical protein
MPARFFIPFSILMLLVAGWLESAAERPDAIFVVWGDGHRSEVSERELKQYTVSSKRPEYPMEARRARLSGAGILISTSIREQRCDTRRHRNKYG